MSFIIQRLLLEYNSLGMSKILTISWDFIWVFLEVCSCHPDSSRSLLRPRPLPRRVGVGGTGLLHMESQGRPPKWVTGRASSLVTLLHWSRQWYLAGVHSTLAPLNSSKYVARFLKMHFCYNRGCILFQVCCKSEATLSSWNSEVQLRYTGYKERIKVFWVDQSRGRGGTLGYNGSTHIGVDRSTQLGTHQGAAPWPMELCLTIADGHKSNFKYTRCSVNSQNVRMISNWGQVGFWGVP